MIEQGAAKPQLLPDRQDLVALNPKTAHAVTTPGSTNSVDVRIPVPRLPFVSSPDVEGDALQVAEGRPILVTLWASWCGHCRAGTGRTGAAIEFDRSGGNLRLGFECRQPVCGLTVVRRSGDLFTEDRMAASGSAFRIPAGFQRACPASPSFFSLPFGSKSPCPYCR